MNKIVTTLEQSMYLRSVGCNPAAASMRYVLKKHEEMDEYELEIGSPVGIVSVPAWTFDDLFSQLPSEFWLGGKCYRLDTDFITTDRIFRVGYKFDNIYHISRFDNSPLQALFFLMRDVLESGFNKTEKKDEED